MVGSQFTRDEVILCAYSARYDGGDFGGIEPIHSLTKRSRDSIQLKINNIAAMLDEENVARESNVNPLSGLPAGLKGRRTNWDIVLEVTPLTRNEHLAVCKDIIRSHQAELTEGAAQAIVVNRYEREPIARQQCIAHHGPHCVVCGFNFGVVYGNVADGFIHVHHLTPLSTIGDEYVLDPISDLRPVCPNCHAVIHLGGTCRSIEEVKNLLVSRAGNS